MQKKKAASAGLPNPRYATARRFDEVLRVAESAGLLRGARTEVVRGRMPKALVERAKAKAGVGTATELIEIALANIAVADDYPRWLLSRRGTVDKDLDLEL